MDRWPICPRTLNLIDYIRNGGGVPAIKVVKKSTGGYIIKDGRHRVLAHKMLGIKQIKADFSNIPIKTI